MNVETIQNRPGEGSASTSRAHWAKHVRTAGQEDLKSHQIGHMALNSNSDMGYTTWPSTQPPTLTWATLQEIDAL